MSPSRGPTSASACSSSSGGRSDHRAFERRGQACRGAFDERPVGLHRGRDPIGATRELDPDDVAGGLEPGQIDDLEFGEPDGLLERGAGRLVGFGIASGLGCAGHGELARELPLDRPRRAAHHPLELTEQRRVTQRLRIHPEGELRRRHASQRTT